MLHFLRDDISQFKNLLKNFKDLDVVFREDVLNSVADSVRNPEKVYYSNVASSMKVMDFCLDSGVQKNYICIIFSNV